MRSPTLAELPPPPPGKTGWPWTEETPPLDLPAAALPTISIVTPSYGQGQYIEQTIRSILLQGYPNLEYVVMDGGSTDGTVEILQKYSPWLATWRSEKDKGQTNAVNKGFACTTGEICAFINSDDWYFPGAFAAVGTRLMQHPNERWWVGWVDNVMGKERERKHSGFTSLPAFMGRREVVHQPGAFWHREAVNKLGPMIENMHYGFDFEYWIRMRQAGYSMVQLDTPIANFRLHEFSKSCSQQHLFNEELWKVLAMYRSALSREEWLEANRGLNEYEAEYLIDNAYALLERNKRTGALLYLLRHVGTLPYLHPKKLYAGALLRVIASGKPPAWWREKLAYQSTADASK